MRDEILEFYKEISPDSYHIEDAAYILQIKGAQELQEFMTTMEELVEEGFLTTKDHEVYVYATKAVAKKGLVRGVYKQGRNGYGFVHPEGEENIYIPEQAVNTAMHDDVVEVEITSYGGGMRKREGIIRKVVERAHSVIVGTYDLQKKAAFVIPDNDRLGDHIYIPLGSGKDARSGAKVAVTITKWPTATKKAEGIVTDVLGYKGDVGLDITTIMAEYGIPFFFS